MGVNCSGCCDRNSRPDFSREVQSAAKPCHRSRDLEDWGQKPSASSKAKYRDEDTHVFLEDVTQVVPTNGRKEDADHFDPLGPGQGVDASTTKESASGNRHCSGDAADKDLSPRLRESADAAGHSSPAQASHGGYAGSYQANAESSPGNAGTCHTILEGSPGSTEDTLSPLPLLNGKDHGSPNKKTWRQSISRTFRSSSKGDMDDEHQEKSKLRGRSMMGDALNGVRKSVRRRSTRKSSRGNEIAPDGRPRLKTTNANAPASYAWLEAPLKSISLNQAGDLGSEDAQTRKAFTPLFFVIGGCPNYFCGMQVIAYFVSNSGDGEVDFWWVKPTKGTGTETEHATMCRQAKGPHKNDPGRSKPFYKPLADMFGEGHTAKDGRRYIIEAPPGTKTPRAVIEEDSASRQERDKLWLQLVWQEDWTSNPLARSKYIKGKLVYQRNPMELEFFSREYCIKDGVMELFREDRPYSSILPDDNIKALYEPV